MVYQLFFCSIIGFVVITNSLLNYYLYRPDTKTLSVFGNQELLHRDTAHRCGPSDLMALKNLTIISNPQLLAEESRCPKSSWVLDLFSSSIYAENKSFVGISVGCNTGVDAIGLCRSLSKNVRFSKASWLSAMEQFSKKRLIAACRSENTVRRGLHADLDELSLAPLMTPRPVSFHCIEPLGSTNVALRKASNYLGLGEAGFMIHKYVISNVSGKVSFPRGKPGTEYLGAYACSDSMVKNCVQTKMLTLDEFAVKYLNSKHDIDVLTIDAEGYDFLVLKGASNVLRRTKYLEFEYHSSWKKEETLKDATLYLQNKNFVCYLAGNERLFKISHGCWLEDFEFRMWSNVVCVKAMETSFLEITEKYFRKLFH